MPEFLLDNIFDMFGGRIFLQTIVIPMGIDLLLSLSTSFTRDKLHAGLINKNEKKLSQSLNFASRYIDGIL